ncbi:MAG: hypothetical protein U0893_23915 [Chloroflexota bacterium]
MSESWKWAPYSRVREAAEELKELIRTRFPDAEFRLVRSEHSRRAWHLLVTTDGDHSLEISDLVVDREVDMLAQEHIPIHVIPRQHDAAAKKTFASPMRKTG